MFRTMSCLLHNSDLHSILADSKFRTYTAQHCCPVRPLSQTTFWPSCSSDLLPIRYDNRFPACTAKRCCPVPPIFHSIIALAYNSSLHPINFDNFGRESRSLPSLKRHEFAQEPSNLSRSPGEPGAP